MAPYLSTHIRREERSSYMKWNEIYFKGLGSSKGLWDWKYVKMVSKG